MSIVSLLTKPSGPCSSHKRRHQNVQTCQMESLEGRVLMTTASVALKGNVLAIDGTWDDDRVEVSYDGRDKVKVVVERERTGETQTHSFRKSSVRKIEFDGNGSDDYFHNMTGIPANADGGWGDDKLIGGSGNDTLRGAGGDDTLAGGSGHDRYVFSDRSELFESKRQNLGTDEIIDRYGVNSLDFRAMSDDVFVDLNVTSEQSVCFAGRGNSVLDLKLSHNDAIDHVYGSRFDDVISGNRLANRLYGSNGDDILWGRDGNDLLVGGRGDDSLYGHDGNDVLQGDSGDDYLSGGDNHDTFRFVGPRLGKDTIAGSGAGINTLDFRHFRGSVKVDLAKTGTQTVNSGDLSLSMLSDQAIDNVWGSRYADTILGNSLKNTLRGNRGNDYIDGRGGRDTMDGGSGTDKVRVRSFGETIRSAEKLSGLWFLKRYYR